MPLCSCHASTCRNPHQFRFIAPRFLDEQPKNVQDKKGNDPDAPGIVEALSGPHRDEFLEAMRNEISELENHGTWTVMKKSEIPSVKEKDGSFAKPAILAGTWAFKVK